LPQSELKEPGRVVLLTRLGAAVFAAVDLATAVPIAIAITITVTITVTVPVTIASLGQALHADLMGLVRIVDRHRVVGRDLRRPTIGICSMRSAQGMSTQPG
jgi:hypothetical protein